MLIFAILLLFTAAAILSLLVIAGMVAGNWDSIGSALRGEGVDPAIGTQREVRTAAKRVRSPSMRAGHEQPLRVSRLISARRAAA